MTVDEALHGVTRIGIDTAPIVYFVERNPAYVATVRSILARVDSGSISGFSSIITLTEVLTQPIRTNRPDIQDSYRELLLRGRNFSLVPVEAAVAEAAAQLRAKYGLRTPDALQVATAVGNNCEAFLTNDAGLRRVSEVRVLMLDEITP